PYGPEAATDVTTRPGWRRSWRPGTRLLPGEMLSERTMGMSDNSAIEWTDASWNCVTGCTKISAGCDNCYAETFAERWRGTSGHHFEQGFDVKLWPDRLTIPMRWGKPKKIFV